ncbi:MAG: DUF177 domain-containing protein [Firmicutes bacterium]|nr:DUF177 domain-containing protein [Bacillota bacterium]
MPLLEVGKLKRSRGKRIAYHGSEILPPLPVAGEEIKPARPVEYRLSLTNAGDAIVVDGTILAELDVCCNRCLSSLVYPLEAPFQETYYDSALPQPDGAQADWVPFSGEQINITPEVVQTMLLHLPMRFICREDCLGLCPVCGADLNKNPCRCVQDEPDPRLAKLKDLLS